MVLWTKKEVEFLKSSYINFTADDLAKRLNRNKRSVQNKLYWLGLKKTRFVLKSEILEKYYNKNLYLFGVKTMVEHNHKGKNNPMYGKHHSKKTKKLLSLINTKFKLSKLKLMSLYHKKNLSTLEISRLYNINPETVRLKMKRLHILRREPSKGNLGKKFTEEHKRKISQTRIIKKLSNGIKNPMSKGENIKKWIKSNHIKPNRPEKILNNLIKKYKLPYIYNGNKANLIIGGRIPDFYNKSKKRKLIEVFGGVFHDPNKSFFYVPYKRTEKGTIRHYKKHNFNTLIIWENELKNPEEVLKKIKSFDENNTFIY